MLTRVSTSTDTCLSMLSSYTQLSTIQRGSMSTQYEYQVVDLQDPVHVFSAKTRRIEDSKQLENTLNERGRQGWKLIHQQDFLSIGGHRLTFMREHDDPIEHRAMLKLHSQEIARQQ